MRKKSYFIAGLVGLIMVATVFLMLPAAVSATIYSYSRFWGSVTLEGQPVQTGSTVYAWINGTGPWTGNENEAISTVDHNGTYVINLPMNSGGTDKDGGVDGDIVNFTVNILNGTTMPDSTTADWQRAGNVHHNIALSGNPPLQITTTSLPGAMLGNAYSYTVHASGGSGSYTWSANGLPTNLNINSGTGVISGIPAEDGNFGVNITVSDSESSVSRQFTLVVESNPNPDPVIITTSELNRWSVEVFPSDPLSSWLPLPVPGWIVNQEYDATLEATGGSGTYVWTASNLPQGLEISGAGEVSGTPTQAGQFDITFRAQDSENAANFDTAVLTLKIYLKGDANGNGTVTIGDVTFCERAILGLNAPNAGCDANLSETISIADVTKIERIILGLP